jgi:Bacterial Ig-like domain (group 3)
MCLGASASAQAAGCPCTLTGTALSGAPGAKVQLAVTVTGSDGQPYSQPLTDLTSTIDWGDGNVFAGTAQSLPLTATVAAIAPATGVPTGTVSFFLDGASSAAGSAVLNAGTASITYAPSIPLVPGQHTATVQYGGDASFGSASSNALSFTVTQTPTTTQLAVPQTIVATAPATLVATVSGQDGPPTGAVAFTDGTTKLGTATLDGSGSATLAATLGAGAHSLAAQYAGDTNRARRPPRARSPSPRSPCRRRDRPRDARRLHPHELANHPVTGATGSVVIGICVAEPVADAERVSVADDNDADRYRHRRRHESRRLAQRDAALALRRSENRRDVEDEPRHHGCAVERRGVAEIAYVRVALVPDEDAAPPRIEQNDKAHPVAQVSQNLLACRAHAVRLRHQLEHRVGDERWKRSVRCGTPSLGRDVRRIGGEERGIREGESAARIGTDALVHTNPVRHLTGKLEVAGTASETGGWRHEKRPVGEALERERLVSLFQGEEFLVRDGVRRDDLDGGVDRPP